MDIIKNCGVYRLSSEKEGVEFNPYDESTHGEDKGHFLATDDMARWIVGKKIYLPKASANAEEEKFAVIKNEHLAKLEGFDVIGDSCQSNCGSIGWGKEGAENWHPLLSILIDGDTHIDGIRGQDSAWFNPRTAYVSDDDLAEYLQVETLDKFIQERLAGFKGVGHEYLAKCNLTTEQEESLAEKYNAFRGDKLGERGKMLTEDNSLATEITVSRKCMQSRNDSAEDEALRELDTQSGVVSLDDDFDDEELPVRQQCNIEECESCQ